MTNLQNMALIQARNELDRAKSDISSCGYEDDNAEERRKSALGFVMSAYDWIDEVIRDPETVKY